MPYSWTFKEPDARQVATTLMRDDRLAVQIFYFVIEFRDRNGWYVRLYERAETLFARWRFRR